MALASSRQLQTVMAGTIVVVLAPGEDWTQVWVDGRIGYVRTDCLNFHAAVTAIVGYALIIREGRTDGRQTVTLHHIPSGYAPKLVSWPTGTRVTVLSADNGWCEVEANGMRGFIRERHLIMLDEE
jgi:SH3-like domain-containing protein